jgi:hypothetical protein
VGTCQLIGSLPIICCSVSSRMLRSGHMPQQGRGGRSFCLLLLTLSFGFSGVSAPATTFHLPDPPPAHAWVEITDLRSGEDPELLLFEQGASQVELGNPPAGLVLVCSGAAGSPVNCEQRFVHPEDEIPLTFSRGAAVGATCLEAGEPAAGAEVSAVPQGLRTRRLFTLPLILEGDELRRTIPTAKDGRFRLPELAPGTYHLEIHFPSGRMFHSEAFTIREPPPSRHTADPDQEPTVALLDLGRLEVQAGAAVEFFVSDFDGQPVEGALVGGGQGDRPENLVTFEGRTNGEGRAVVSGFRTDQPVRLACRKDGYAGDFSKHEVVPAIQECRLTPLVTVVGRVLDAEEEPLVGATVSVKRSRLRVASTEDGNFELDGLKPETRTLQVTAPGFAAAEVAVELVPGERRRELEPVILEPAPQVTGRVLDAETEAPIPGAEIEVTDPPGFGSVTSDADGAFVLEAASPDGLGLRVSSPGYAAVNGRVPAADLESGEEIKIELSRGGRIRVRVWDEDAGGLCAGCRVVFSGPDHGRLYTDEDGVALSEPVAPGSYVVERPYSRTLGSITFVEAGHGRTTAEVHAGEVVEVELGEPVVTQELVFEPPPPPGWMLTSQSATRSDSYRPTLDGRVELRRRPGEEVTLQLDAPGLYTPRVRVGVLPPTDGSGTERLRLPETLLAGTVVRGEEPVGESRIALVSVQDGLVWGSTRTDAEGRFTIPFAAPGTYLVQVDDRLTQTVVLGRDERRELGELQVP